MSECMHEWVNVSEWVSEQLWVNLLRSSAWVGDEEPDVYADDGDDDAEEGEDGHLADEFDADKHPDEHDDEEAAAVYPVIVKCMCRISDRGKDRRLGHHVLLNDQRSHQSEHLHNSSHLILKS